MSATNFQQFSDVSLSHLDRVGHSVQELDDEQRRDFSLDDGQEEELAPEYADEIMVRGLQDRRHILGFHGFLLSLEEVVAHTPADDTLPVFLQEDVSRVIDEKQAVDHLRCNSRVNGVSSARTNKNKKKQSQPKTNLSKVTGQQTVC